MINEGDTVKLAEMLTPDKFRAWLEAQSDSTPFYGNSATLCPIAKYVSEIFPEALCSRTTILLEGPATRTAVFFDNGTLMPVWAQNYSQRAASLPGWSMSKRQAIDLLDRVLRNCDIGGPHVANPVG